MGLVVLAAVIGGVLWGRFGRPLTPLLRRGVPGAAIALGLVGLRLSINSLGAEAVQAGQFDLTGLVGGGLMIFGLFALLTLVLGHIATELKTTAKFSRRK